MFFSQGRKFHRLGATAEKVLFLLPANLLCWVLGLTGEDESRNRSIKRSKQIRTLVNSLWVLLTKVWKMLSQPIPPSSWILMALQDRRKVSILATWCLHFYCFSITITHQVWLLNDFHKATRTATFSSCPDISQGAEKYQTSLNCLNPVGLRVIGKMQGKSGASYRDGVTTLLCAWLLSVFNNFSLTYSFLLAHH